MENFEKLYVMEWKFSGFPQISTKRLDENMHNVRWVEILGINPNNIHIFDEVQYSRESFL